MVWEGPTCLLQDPQVCPPGCLVSLLEGLPSHGLKAALHLHLLLSRLLPHL